MQRPWSAAYCVLHGVLSLLSYTTQDPPAQGWQCPQEVGPPSPITGQSHSSGLLTAQSSKEAFLS